MAIYYYDGDQRNPPKYQGIRVNVMVAGKVKQKWFNFRTEYKSKEAQAEATKVAKKLNFQWVQEKKMQQFMKIDDFTHTRKTIYGTGIRGISMKFVITTKKKNKKRYLSYIPKFIVQIVDKHGKHRSQSYNILRHGYDMAWLKACQYLAQSKGISNLDKLTSRKPEINNFLQILFHQRQKGHSIPTNKLPKELLTALIESNCEASKIVLNNLLIDGEDVKTFIKPKAEVTA